MSFLFEFLGTSSMVFPQPLEYPAAFCGIMGASCYLAAFLPAFYTVYRTKNTVGLSRSAFLVHFFVSFFAIIGSVSLIADGFLGGIPNEKGERINGVVMGKVINGVIFSTLNLTCGLCNAYVFFLKEKNISESKKYSMTELEHYIQLCAPKIREQELKRISNF